MKFCTDIWDAFDMFLPKENTKLTKGTQSISKESISIFELNRQIVYNNTAFSTKKFYYDSYSSLAFKIETNIFLLIHTIFVHSTTIRFTITCDGVTILTKYTPAESCAVNGSV